LFITDSGNEYTCYFTLYDNLFSNFPRIAPFVYGFTLALTSLVTHKTGLDKRIADTTVTIISDFLNKKSNAVVYICDNSDNREKARFHKFNHWFTKYNDGKYIQLRGVIRAGGINILNAMLIHKENKLLNDFIEAHEILTGQYTKPDDDELQNILNDDGW
jgi:Family of unknown function (DUF6169)